MISNVFHLFLLREGHSKRPNIALRSLQDRLKSFSFHLRFSYQFLFASGLDLGAILAPFWSSSLPGRPGLLSSKRQKMTHGLPRCKKSRPRGRQEHQRPPQDLPQGSPNDPKLHPGPSKNEFKDNLFILRCFSSLFLFLFSSLFSSLFSPLSSALSLLSCCFSFPLLHYGGELPYLAVLGRSWGNLKSKAASVRLQDRF